MQFWSKLDSCGHLDDTTQASCGLYLFICNLANIKTNMLIYWAEFPRSLKPQNSDMNEKHQKLPTKQQSQQLEFQTWENNPFKQKNNQQKRRTKDGNTGPLCGFWTTISHKMEWMVLGLVIRHLILNEQINLFNSHSGDSSICPREPSPALGPGTPGGTLGGRCHTGWSLPPAGRPRSSPGGRSRSRRHPPLAKRMKTAGRRKQSPWESRCWCQDSVRGRGNKKHLNTFSWLKDKKLSELKIKWIFLVSQNILFVSILSY